MRRRRLLLVLIVVIASELWLSRQPLALFTHNVVNASPASWVLSVEKQGGGASTVVSEPSGIDCGSTCSAAFAADSTVTLEVITASGFDFSGWAGVCSGTAHCTVTMDSDKTVTAIFESTTETDTPISGLTISHNGPKPIGDAVNFEASITAGDNVSYSWEFGDGGSAVGATVDHTYQVSGEYIVTLTASNQSGVVQVDSTVVVPSAEDTPTPTGTATPTNTPTATKASTPTDTATPTRTATSTVVPNIDPFATPSPLHIPIALAKPDRSGSPPPFLAPETVVLSTQASQSLTAISADGSVFTFDYSSQVANLSPGAVLVGQPSSLAPSGFLRRVMRVTAQAGQLRVETEFATLEDAILQGEIAFSMVLTPQDVAGAQLPAGVRIVRPAGDLAADGLYLEFEDVVVYDGDKNFSTIDDQVRASGHVEANPKIDWKWVKYYGERPDVVIDLVTTVETNLQFAAGPQIDETLLKDFEVFELPAGRIVVPVGPMPVWVDLVLRGYLRVDGKASAQVNLGAALKDLVTVRASTVPGDTPLSASVDSLENSFEWDGLLRLFTLKGSIKGYLFSAVETRVYSVGGPFVGPAPYFELVADPTDNPWLALYFGVDVETGMRGEILGRSIGKFAHTVVGYRTRIAEATWPATAMPTPTTMPTLTPTPTPTIPPSNSPTIRIEPKSGVSGTRFNVYGSNFVPGESVIQWAISPTGSRSEDPTPNEVGGNGTYTSWIELYGAQPRGTWTFYARGSVSNETASTTFELVD